MNGYSIAGIVFALLSVGFYGGTLASRAHYEALQVKQANSLSTSYQKLLDQRDAKQKATEKELADLKLGEITSPNVVVRMCDAPVPAVPSAAGRTTGPQLPAAAGILPADHEPVPPAQGPDYGPTLFALADLADTIAAKCR